MARKKVDWIVIILWPIAASLLSLFLRLNLFASTLLFYVLPSIYISLKHKRFIKKTLIASFVALPVFLVMDYIAETTGAWYFPTSILINRLFGVIPFEVVFWLFTYAYFVIIFYEYFLDEKCTHKLSAPRLKYVFIAFVLLLIFFLAVLGLTGAFVKIPYFYLVYGILFAIIPVISVLIKFPNLFTKFAEATVYFSISSFLWELVALRLNQWSFPGNSFIGWVEFAGVRFPFEEFLIWIVLGAAAILSWYDFFDDYPAP